ncbi:MAG TPA: hypothetical protein VFQ61_09370, partial [Polyangiaceae bacterium]|nr:hypothetical protein [Polyangiaceae bacterium]
MRRRNWSLSSSLVLTARSRLLRLGAAAYALLAPAPAAAQTDINPPLPNVLLLVDTSGSMEYKVGSSSFPNCDPTGSQSSEKSRWVDLIEVLTGSIRNYRCERINRAQASFGSGEYGTGGPLGLRSYDYLYENPFHRPLSGTCAVGPGTLPTNPYQFPDTALKYHAYNDNNSTCTFNQARDGILDAFENSIRFGLMTFDPNTDPSTGLTGTGGADFAGGIKGTWSYVWGNAAKANP